MFETYMTSILKPPPPFYPPKKNPKLVWLASDVKYRLKSEVRNDQLTGKNFDRVLVETKLSIMKVWQNLLMKTLWDLF